MPRCPSRARAPFGQSSAARVGNIRRRAGATVGQEAALKGFLQEQLRLAVFCVVLCATSLLIMLVWTRLVDVWSLSLILRLPLVGFAILLGGVTASFYLSSKIFAWIGVPLHLTRTVAIDIRRSMILVVLFLVASAVCFIYGRWLRAAVFPFLNPDGALAGPIRFVFAEHWGAFENYSILAAFFVLLLPGFETALVVRRLLGWAKAE
jgi:hypothetical protein